MLAAYAIAEKGVTAVGDPALAAWIDLLRPDPDEVARVEALGVGLPTLADMEEIEISNRLFREEGTEYLTVVLPGQSAEGGQIAGPVTFILAPGRLITLRHHAPRPFETFPARAGQSGTGCATAEQLFAGLIGEIVARLADLLEAAGRVLDQRGRAVFAEDTARDPEALQATLRAVGQQGELIGRVRLALLTLERALSFFGSTEREASVAASLAGLLRDIAALSVHCDYLSSRIGLTVDATLGLVNLMQNASTRIFSLVAVLFLPPTLVASAYGMNFAHMPELAQPWGYPAALALMLGSALGCYLVFRWKNWL
jgi:magnesium transporter